VTCPAPELFKALPSAYQHAYLDPENKEAMSAFVQLLRKAMLKFDCMRPLDTDPVPVWYLCGSSEEGNAYACSDEDVGKWFYLLATAKSRDARELFASKLFRNTLDGMFGEAYREESLRVEMELKMQDKH